MKYNEEMSFKQQQEQLEKEMEARKESGDLPVANIIVAGISGAGKSTLINAMFGEEMAATGCGRPVTDHIAEYSNASICIWDTVGFEIDSEKTSQSIQSIKATIASKTSAKDPMDRIHAVWYCISADSKRFQSAEMKFIKTLYDAQVPFIIALTKCYGDERETNEFANSIKNGVEEEGLKGIEIVQVLAQPYKLRGGGTVESFGVNKLVNETMKKLPDFVVSGFVAAQKVNKEKKRHECELIILDTVQKSRGILSKVFVLGEISIGGWDLYHMFVKIVMQYNGVIPENSIEQIWTKHLNLKELAFMYAEASLPFYEGYEKRVDEFFQTKKNDGFNIDVEQLSKKDKVPKFLAYLGFVFVDAIEQLWDEINAGKIKELQEKTARLAQILEAKFKNI